MESYCQMMKVLPLMKFKTKYVHFIPEALEVGILYVSQEFETAAHVCPCGCRTKIRTPLGVTEWRFIEEKNGPTLYPSIGNWQLACKSHYWIEDGIVLWAKAWSESQIISGRKNENYRRKVYFEGLPKADETYPSIGKWIKFIIKRFFK